MTLTQLIIVSGASVVLVMGMGAAGLLILLNLAEPTESALSAEAAAQLQSATALSSSLSFPTMPPSYMPTLTATATHTLTASATGTPGPAATETPTSTPPPSETPVLTSTPRPSATSAPTLPVAPTNPASVGDFQYQFTYSSDRSGGIRGPVETFGNGTIRLKWTYANAPQQGFFRIVMQRQFDEQIYILEDVVGNSGSGQVDFHLPASGEYVFVIDTLAGPWRVDVYFKSD